MYRFKLLGAAGLAALLMAAPAFAANDTTNGTAATNTSTATNPTPMGNASAAPASTASGSATPSNTAAANTGATNTGAANAVPGVPAGSEIYATVGQGGYTADHPYITNGNTRTPPREANNSDLRPSQRNVDLADNGSARASKVIGTDVYNTHNQKLGSVNDILIGKDGKLFAVITTNQKKVGVPFDQLKFGDTQYAADDKIVLPNETQTKLNTEPEIHYNESKYQGWRAVHDNMARNNENGSVVRNGNGMAGRGPAPVANGNNHS